MNNSKYVRFASIAFILTALFSIQYAHGAHTGISNVVYGIRTDTFAPTLVDRFDPSTDTSSTISLTSTVSLYPDGRGIAFDGTDILYSVIKSAANGYLGDGLIHKVAPTGGADLGTIPDPYGIDGRGIGALDFDGGSLWAVSYKPSGINTETIFKLDPSNGNVLASCDIAFQGGGVGTDTLAVIDGVIVTDAGELLTTLFRYVPPTTTGGSCVAASPASYVLPIGVTGVDTDASGNLVAADLFSHNVYNLGGAPYSTIVASQSSAFPGFTEDITVAFTSHVGVPEFDLGVNVMIAFAASVYFVLTKLKRSSSRTLTA